MPWAGPWSRWPSATSPAWCVFSACLSVSLFSLFSLTNCLVYDAIWSFGDNHRARLCCNPPRPLTQRCAASRGSQHSRLLIVLRFVRSSAPHNTVLCSCFSHTTCNEFLISSRASASPGTPTTATSPRGRWTTWLARSSSSQSAPHWLPWVPWPPCQLAWLRAPFCSLRYGYYVITLLSVAMFLSFFFSYFEKYDPRPNMLRLPSSKISCILTLKGLSEKTVFQVTIWFLSD